MAGTILYSSRDLPCSRRPLDLYREEQRHLAFYPGLPGYPLPFRMNRTLVVLALVAGLATLTMGFSPETLNEYPVADDNPEGRFFISTNATSVTVGYASFILGITSLLVLGAVLALAYFYATGEDSGSYGYSGYSGSSDSSYGSHGRKAYVTSNLSGYCNRRAVSSSPRPPLTPPARHNLLHNHNLTSTPAFAPTEIPCPHPPIITITTWPNTYLNPDGGPAGHRRCGSFLCMVKDLYGTPEQPLQRVWSQSID